MPLDQDPPPRTRPLSADALLPEHADATAGGIAWWPFRAFTQRPLEAGALSIWAAWLALTAVSVAFAVLEAVFDWSGMPLSIGTGTVGFSIYPPVAISALVTFWLGPAYGAATAYVSTLASGAVGGLDPTRTVLFALGTPSGVLLLWFLALMLRVRPHMPAYRDYWRFCAAALIAATASSLDVMLYNEWHRLPLETGQRLWQGWIFGDTAQLCFVVAPLLYFTWGPVHAYLAARLGAPRRSLSTLNTVLLLGVVWTTLAGLALLGLRLMATALDIPTSAVTAGGDPLGSRIREMETFLAVLVCALLLSTIALTAELVAGQERTLALSLRDDLTGAFNRRAFRVLFERLHERVGEDERPLSLLYVDLDRFKLINDRFGHAAGDRVLVAVTREAHAVLRQQDLLFRWGGDEFVILLPSTSRGEASEIAARLRARVESRISISAEPTPPPMTVSIGVATMPFRDAQQTDLVEAADAAVRLAKSLGRNRVATDLMDGESSTARVSPAGA